MRYPIAAASVAAFFLSLSALCSAPAFASAKVGVDPLRAELPARTLTASFNLRNKGQSVATFQAEVFAWQQINGKDELVATKDLVVAPPVFTIQPNSRQVVRVGRLKPEAVPTVEKTYRLILTEVAPQGGVDQKVGIASALKLSLPVLVPPQRRDPLALQWDASRAGPDDLRLSLLNGGNTSVRLSRISLLQGGKVVASKSIIGYALAGATRSYEWDGALKNANPRESLELMTEYDNRKTYTQVLDLRVLSVVPLAKP